MIRELFSAKVRFDCDYDDILIIIGCVSINTSIDLGHANVLQPAPIISIADYIGMSRETVRRRLARLESKRIVLRMSSGYIVNDVEKWIGWVDKVFK